MLILTRRIGESIIINDDIKVTVLEVSGSAVKIGIQAPREVSIFREEIAPQYEGSGRADKKS